MVKKEKGGYKVEATINAKGTIFRAEMKADDPYDAVDRVIENCRARCRSSSQKPRINIKGSS